MRGFRFLFWCEYRKIFEKKTLYIFLAIAVLFPLALRTYAPSGTTYSDYLPYENQNLIEDEWTEYIQSLRNQYDETKDPALDTKLRAASHIQIFLANMTGYKDTVKALQSQIQALGKSDWTEKPLLQKYHMLQQRGPVNFFYTEGYQGIIQYLSIVSGLLITLLLMMAVGDISSKDRESGLEPIILSTVHGRKRLFWAKLLAAISSSTTLAVFLWIGLLGISGLRHGLHNGLQPMAALMEHALTPYPFPIILYMLILFVFTVITSASVAAILVFLSSWLKHTLYISAVVILTLIVSTYYSFSSGAGELLNRFFILQQFDAPGKFMTYKAAALMGLPVLAPVFSLVIILMYGLAGCLLGYQVYQKREAV